MEPDDQSSSAASEGADLGLRGPAWVGARVSSGQPIPVAGTWEVVDHLGCHTSGELHAFHTVRGTPADGELGPDLTHLASRETIGAGVVELSESSLADFVADPQDDKPGASMPPTELSPEEVAAVVAYLMELE